MCAAVVCGHPETLSRNETCDNSDDLGTVLQVHKVKEHVPAKISMKYKASIHVDAVSVTGVMGRGVPVRCSEMNSEMLTKVLTAMLVGVMTSMLLHVLSDVLVSTILCRCCQNTCRSRDKGYECSFHNVLLYFIIQKYIFHQ